MQALIFRKTKAVLLLVIGILVARNKAPEHQPLYREQIKSFTTLGSSKPRHLINQILKIHTFMVFSYGGPSMHFFAPLWKKISKNKCLSML